MKIILSLACSAFVILFLPIRASAQSYSIDWFTLDAGGGNSAGGSYSLDGSIGQPEAGPTLSGGSFSLTGGYWSLVAVPTTSAPVLHIFLTPTNTAVIFWPSASTGFALQQNSQLGTSNWVAATQTNHDDGTNKFIIVNPTTGTRYYRLSRP
jgi:hypothetical protein